MLYSHTGVREMGYLDFPVNILRCVGVFPLSDDESRSTVSWSSRAFHVYQTVLFVLTTTTTVLMSVQVFVAPNMNLLTRTVNIYTMFLSGLYKWCVMRAFSGRYAELDATLDRVQAQGSVAYHVVSVGCESADAYTANYLKHTRTLSALYLLIGILGAVTGNISPFFSYSKRYTHTYICTDSTSSI